MIKMLLGALLWMTGVGLVLWLVRTLDQAIDSRYGVDVEVF